MKRSDFADESRRQILALADAVQACMPGLMVEVRRNGVAFIWPQGGKGIFVVSPEYAAGTKPGVPSVQAVVDNLMMVGPVLGHA
ncbi:hypothetical protein ACQR1H_03125 [Bradyrhizobium sp. HKCCYLRH2015]|uniref:hypothetical protein n=1 Tax=Bradyrhizobium sp. HKCCYLRH2015 TaxID=3420742 RepID=UPI003EBAF4D0